MIKQAIEKIVDKQNLTYDEAYAVMNEVMNGESSAMQNAAFLAALSTKIATSETVDEITGCAAAMRDHSLQVTHGMEVLEIAGTGGDGSSSFNISTTSAFVIAAAGVKVAKHGNRAASSQSGTADCLEALGANISIEPEQCVRLLQEAGFCFFFTRKYQAVMQPLGELCREMGIRSAYHILGALVNPACPTSYLMGVYDEYLVEPLAKVLANLGVRRGLVIYGQDKLDEISMSAPTTICEIRDGFFKTYVITPEDFGFKRCSREELVGGTPEVNAEITRDILEGKDKGPKSSIVLLNAGAGIFTAGAASGIAEGIRIAGKAIESGEALRRLEEFIRLSKETI